MEKSYLITKKILTFILCAVFLNVAVQAQTIDILLKGGYVIDPKN